MLTAKKFGIDWPDCVLQCGEERSSLSLKALSNWCLNITENPLHKKVKGLIVNFYLKFTCSFRKTFCLSLTFVLNDNIVFCFLSQICNVARVMTFSENNFQYDLE